MQTSILAGTAPQMLSVRPDRRDVAVRTASLTGAVIARSGRRVVREHSPVDRHHRLAGGGPQPRCSPRRRWRAGRAGRPPVGPSGRSRRPACRRRGCDRWPAPWPVPRPGPTGRSARRSPDPARGSTPAPRDASSASSSVQSCSVASTASETRRAAPTPARRPPGAPRTAPPRPPPPARPGRARPRPHGAGTRRPAGRPRSRSAPSIRPASVTSPSAGEVAARGEQPADPVERTRQRPGPAGHPLPQLLGVALQPAPPLGPAGVLLAVGAGVARVPAQLRAQLGQPVVLATAPAAAAPPASAGPGPCH